MEPHVSLALRDDEGFTRREDLCGIFKCTLCPALVIPERGEIMFCTCSCHADPAELIPEEWHPTV